MPGHDRRPCRVVVLVSGSGSNLQALIDACANGEVPAQIVAVISNRADAYALQRAAGAGIATGTLAHGDFESREAFDEALAGLVDGYQPDLLVLAGFMRILTRGFTEKYAGKMLNIHPSLLPKYPGLHTHQRALDDSEPSAGATVHFVTGDLDAGPAVLQAEVPVLEGDTATTLAARVLEQEHRIYPLALGWFASGRLCLAGGQALLDGEALPPGGRKLAEVEAEAATSAQASLHQL